MCMHSDRWYKPVLSVYIIALCYIFFSSHSTRFLRFILIFKIYSTRCRILHGLIIGCFLSARFSIQCFRCVISFTLTSNPGAGYCNFGSYPKLSETTQSLNRRLSRVAALAAASCFISCILLISAQLPFSLTSGSYVPLSQTADDSWKSPSTNHRVATMRHWASMSFLWKPGVAVVSLEHCLLSLGPRVLVLKGHQRNSELQIRSHIFSVLTNWVKGQLSVISVTTFAQVGWRDAGVCHRALPNHPCTRGWKLWLWILNMQTLVASLWRIWTPVWIPLKFWPLCFYSYMNPVE